MKTPNTISREAALAAGLTRFYTGEPCLRGHLAERYVNCPRRCVACKQERDGGKFQGERAPDHRMPLVRAVRDQRALVRSQLTYMRKRLDELTVTTEQAFETLLDQINLRNQRILRNDRNLS